MSQLLDNFKKAGMSASYHYADNTGKEWGAAHKLERECLNMFDANPDSQDEMREIAKGFLWSLNSTRPNN